jgi:hypothetical protein
MVEDLRSLLREFAGLKPQPTAMTVGSRILQSTPESGVWATIRAEFTRGERYCICGRAGLRKCVT